MLACVGFTAGSMRCARRSGRPTAFSNAICSGFMASVADASIEIRCWKFFDMPYAAARSLQQSRN
jgi:hypothetical protein